MYFWEGNYAPQTGWLTYTFDLQKKLEKHAKGKFDVLKVKQQQENYKFLSHFNQRFIIHHGKRKLSKPIRKRKGCLDKPVQPVTHDQVWMNKPSLYEIRSNAGFIGVRCVQIETSIENFNSEFCYVLKVPLTRRSHEEDEIDDQAMVYGWVGRTSPTYMQELVPYIMETMYPVQKENGDYTGRVA